MPNDGITRKLTAIFYADVAGYSRMTGEDEEGTHRAVMALLDAATEIIGTSGGNVLRYAGDAILAEFASVTAAVRTATDIQTGLTDSNVQIRIGINLGEVMADRGEIYGDGVNLAARLESVAEPGGVCISTSVYEQTNGKTNTTFVDGGVVELKNIARPTQIYRWKPIQNSDVAAATSSSDAHLVTKQSSVAVLPFDNMSNDPDQEYFSDGITEDIITEISKFRALDVIARNSSFAFKGQNLDVMEIGESLNVDYVLEGSVRKAGNRVRVTAQLIDAKNNHHIWADRYDRDLDDIFAVQDEVTEAIVSVMIGQLSDAARERATRKLPKDMNAYDLVLQASVHLHRYTKADSQKMLPLVERAVELDPTYALAHAMLGFSRMYLYYWSGIEGDPRDMEQAREDVERAITLDPNDSFIQWTYGWVCGQSGDLDRAMQCAQRAIELNPNDTDCMAHMGMTLCYMGEKTEAMDWISKAQRLDPNVANWQREIEGIIRFCCRDYEGCINALSKATTWASWFWLYTAMSNAQLGHAELARKQAQKAFGVAWEDEESQEGQPTDDQRQRLLENMAGDFYLFRLESDRTHFIESLALLGLSYSETST